MRKLLTICIPTFKRPDTLCRCIDSIVSQVEKYTLSAFVDIYVTNDASPDETASVLRAYESKDYFSAVTREQNLGMNVNIMRMLGETAIKSEYQLIVTDDDYLQPDILDKVVDFLRRQQADDRAPAIWTPRYSYTEDGELHCVSCKAFSRDARVNPSAFNAGRYMANGFVLSGLVVCAEQIDFVFWEEYRDNAYFPMIFFGDLVLHRGAYYWDRNIVHHTVLNKCHWESWGRNDLLIELKKFSDYVNAYCILSTRIRIRIELFRFLVAAFPSIIRAVGEQMHSDNLKNEKEEILDAIREQKDSGVLKIGRPVYLLMPYALLASAMIAIAKLAALRMLLLVFQSGGKGNSYRKSADAYWASLRAIPTMQKLIR